LELDDLLSTLGLEKLLEIECIAYDHDGARENAVVLRLELRRRRREREVRLYTYRYKGTRASFHTTCIPGTGKKTPGGAGANIPVRLCPVSRVCPGSPGVLLPVRFRFKNTGCGAGMCHCVKV
jgi:hypothetical protein